MSKAIPQFEDSDAIFAHYGAFKARMVSDGTVVEITIIGDDEVYLKRKDGGFEPLRRDEVLVRRDGSDCDQVYTPSLFGSHFLLPFQEC